jgi:hypothetical protein
MLARLQKSEVFYTKDVGRDWGLGRPEVILNSSGEFVHGCAAPQQKKICRSNNGSAIFTEHFWELSIELPEKNRDT